MLVIILSVVMNQLFKPNNPMTEKEEVIRLLEELKTSLAKVRDAQGEAMGKVIQILKILN